MNRSGIKYVLLDIEGTVLPISFVKDVLFVYVRKHLDDFLEQNWKNDEVQKTVKEIQKFSKTNEESPPVETLNKESIIKNILWQMDRDMKTAGLKALQGLIWVAGYRKCELIADLYEDVCPAMMKWHAQGIKIGIYSSGSIFAQRLLFEHTRSGSMLNIIDSFHDLTTAGSKLQSSSYTSIAEQISYPVDQILFLTDVYGEYKAACTAGMHSAITLRDGNKPLTEEEEQGVQLISTFDEISLN